MSVAIASAFALTRFGGQVAQTTPAPSFFPAILRRSTQRGRAMLYLVLKAGLSGVIIAAASELARRAPALGALILSLPLVSLLAFIWLWGDGGDNARIAALSESTFWYVLPTLPMFLVLPALLRHGVGFWTAMLACCALTFALYLLTVWALGKFGFTL
jgi:hypothetical protein